jgi:hypothetical protein
MKTSDDSNCGAMRRLSCVTVAFAMLVASYADAAQLDNTSENKPPKETKEMSGPTDQRGTLTVVITMFDSAMGKEVQLGAGATARIMGGELPKPIENGRVEFIKVPKGPLTLQVMVPSAPKAECVIPASATSGGDRTITVQVDKAQGGKCKPL